MKHTIGLTGGIASGKSTVGKILMGFGVTVIDADQLSREVVAPGTAGLGAILAEFGEEYQAEDGGLDRKKLGGLVFKQPRAMERLNAIMHPRISRLADERIRAAKDTSTPYVVYEAAILVELGTYKNMSKLIVVAADAELQVRRVMVRNQLTEAEARDRLAAQYPLEKKLAVASYVIHNDDDRDALVERTRQVHEKILGL
jgi:dephospho-CoA kinase